jgi:general secretion pathway protein G
MRTFCPVYAERTSRREKETDVLWHVAAAQDKTFTGVFAMNAIRKHSARGFTLVEILIVVIILGILAAIVIPQFTNASEDARKSSLVSQLQTLRSQIELFKLQHRDAYPTSTGLPTGTWDWDMLTEKTNDDLTQTGTPKLGPYLQAPPVNGLTGGSNMRSVTDDATAIALTNGDIVGTLATEKEGFVFSQATGKCWAFDKAGAIYNEQP